MTSPVPDSLGSLRTVSDKLLRDLEVLGVLEEQKRTLQPDDPQLVEIAGRITEIAQRVLNESVHQHRLTEMVSAQAATGAANAPATAIADTPRPLAAIIAEWRDAERRLSAAEPGSVEEAESAAQVSSLRDEYRRAYEAARNR